MKIVVGITGATGVIYGIKLLKKLKTHPEVSTVLAMSEWAEKTIALETDYTAEYVRSLADEVCSNGNMAEGIFSGSYKVDATVIIPCTVKTLSCHCARIRCGTDRSYGGCGTEGAQKAYNLPTRNSA